MPAQVELVVLVLVIAAGVAYVAVRVRRGALEEERATEAGEPPSGREAGGAEPPDPPAGDGG